MCIRIAETQTILGSSLGLHRVLENVLGTNMKTEPRKGLAF